MNQSLNAQLDQRLAEFQTLFHQQLPDKIEEINLSWRALCEQWSDENLEQLHRFSHSLAGSGATFGATTVSQAACALDKELRALIKEASIPGEEKRTAITALLAELTTVAASWSPH